MRAVPQPAVAALALAGAGYLIAGTAGVVVVAVLVYVGVLIAMRSRFPAAPGLRRRRRRTTPVDNPQFPSYRRLDSILGWGTNSPRHFDHVVRPTLQMLTAAVLAERRGLDLYADHEAVSELLGDEAWQLVDPRRTASEDSSPPGVAVPVVERLVRRLELL